MNGGGKKTRRAQGRRGAQTYKGEAKKAGNIAQGTRGGSMVKKKKEKTVTVTPYRGAKDQPTRFSHKTSGATKAQTEFGGQKVTRKEAKKRLGKRTLRKDPNVTIGTRTVSIAKKKYQK